MMQILDEWRHITKGSFIVLILLVPLAVAAAFGYVYQNNSVQEAPLAVVDLDHSTYSNQLLVKLDASQYVQVLDVYNNYIEADMLLYNEKYSGVLYLPAGMEAAAIQGKPINLGLNLDMTMSAVAATVRSGVTEVIATENAGRGLNVLVLEQRTLYNPTNSTIMSTVVMFVNVIMLSFIALNTLSIVPRLRQSGTLKEELKKPIGILSRTIPYALITCIAFYLSMGVLKLIGGLRFEADWLQMFIPFFLYTASTSLMCMMIGWTAENPMKSAARIVLIMLPSFLLSGAQVPYCMLPGPLQMINQVLPLSLQFKFLRGMGYKGGQLAYFMPEIGHYLLIITLFCTVILLLLVRDNIKLSKAETESGASIGLSVGEHSLTA